MSDINPIWMADIFVGGQCLSLVKFAADPDLEQLAIEASQGT